MKKRIYVETTIVSYLTARPSRDLVKAARQEITREWWESCRSDFDVYASQVVTREAREGDTEMADRRKRVLDELPLLDLTDEALDLAARLIEEGPMPEEAAVDALHIAIATESQMDFLVTWNCRHLANAALRGAVMRKLWEWGCNPPEICTPEELMGELS